MSESPESKPASKPIAVRVCKTPLYRKSRTGLSHESYIIRLTWPSLRQSRSAMRPPCLAAVVSLCLGLLVLGSETPSASVSNPPEDLWLNELVKRGAGGHHHGSTYGQPLLVLNETELLQYHQRTPASYYTIDWEEEGDPAAVRHPGLMAAHAVFMTLAFFVALPIGLVFCHPLREVNSDAQQELSFGR